MQKTFMTYEQQLNYLECNKDLIIPDRKYAKTMLERISYYSLIGGYKEPFKHRPSGKYLLGVTSALAYYGSGQMQECLCARRTAVLFQDKRPDT